MTSTKAARSREQQEKHFQQFSARKETPERGICKGRPEIVGEHHNPGVGLAFDIGSPEHICGEGILPGKCEKICIFADGTGHVRFKKALRMRHRWRSRRRMGSRKTRCPYVRRWCEGRQEPLFSAAFAGRIRPVPTETVIWRSHSRNARSTAATSFSKKRTKMCAAGFLFLFFMRSIDKSIPILSELAPYLLRQIFPDIFNMLCNSRLIACLVVS